MMSRRRWRGWCEMGVSSRGYRNDPGPQVVRVSLVHLVGPPVKAEDVDAFLEAGIPMPTFRVVFNDTTELYDLREEKAAFSALEKMGHRFVDVIVEGEALGDVEVEEG